MDIVLLLIGLAVGFAAAWAVLAQKAKNVADRVRGESAAAVAASDAKAQAAEEERARAQSATASAADRAAKAEAEVAGLKVRLEQQVVLLSEQATFVERTKRETEAVFHAAAAKALDASSRQFLELASQRFHTTQAEAVAALEERKKGVEALVAPLKEQLAGLAKKTEEMEQRRAAAYADIAKHVDLLMQATAAAERQTTTLSTALRGSHVRGRWGEVALRNVVEFAGMTEHCDFEEQATTDAGSRPDLTVRLPGSRKIAVDSKAPMDAYFAAAEAASDGDRKSAMASHVAAIREHLKALVRRDYAKALGGGVDLVVMFLPADPLLGAALAHDPSLQEEAYRARILLASPTILLALLKTVAIYHKQEAIARDSEVIARTARDLYERLAVFAGHLSGVGEGLHKALDAYDKTVSSYRTRIRPLAGRIEEMKVPAQPDARLDAPETVDQRPALPEAGAPPPP